MAVSDGMMVVCTAATINAMPVLLWYSIPNVVCVHVICICVHVICGRLPDLVWL
jgi:hypothetical protein